MEAGKTELETKLQASLRRSEQGEQRKAETASIACRRRVRGAEVKGESNDSDNEFHRAERMAPLSSGTAPRLESRPDQMNLRHKLGEVRRRIGYIQKRGYNERNNYNYVAAADIAGTIGDILAELGVVVIPRLESISYEPHAPGRMERVARVIMSYTFTDEDSGDEITAKVAGEGLDVGDKASYKAMTGALKYALLQSFLLATGDDPEDERGDSRSASGSERLISTEQVGELQNLIDQSGADRDRVLAYYKISSLEEMTQASYRRALELLKRKLEKQAHLGEAHAQN
jgi:hypothetical protein